MASASAPVDLDRLGLVSDRDPAVIRGLIDVFRRESERQLRALAAAAEPLDRPAAMEALHSLKGSSANIGATRLAQIARAGLDIPADELTAPTVRVLMGQLTAELARVIETLEDLEESP